MQSNTDLTSVSMPSSVKHQIQSGFIVSAMTVARKSLAEAALESEPFVSSLFRMSRSSAGSSRGTKHLNALAGYFRDVSPEGVQVALHTGADRRGEGGPEEISTGINHAAFLRFSSQNAGVTPGPGCPV